MRTETQFIRVNRISVRFFRTNQGISPSSCMTIVVSICDKKQPQPQRTVLHPYSIGPPPYSSPCWAWCPPCSTLEILDTSSLLLTWSSIFWDHPLAAPRTTAAEWYGTSSYSPCHWRNGGVDQRGRAKIKYGVFNERKWNNRGYQSCGETKK